MKIHLDIRGSPFCYIRFHRTSKKKLKISKKFKNVTCRVCIKFAIIHKRGFSCKPSILKLKIVTDDMDKVTCQLCIQEYLLGEMLIKNGKKLFHK